MSTIPRHKSPVGKVLDCQYLFDTRKLDDDNKPKVHPMYELWVGFEKGAAWTAFWNEMATVGMAGWPNGECKAPGFSWKVKDGDTATTQKGEPYPDHCKGMMLVSFSLGDGYEPPLVMDLAGNTIADPSMIYQGCFVQVLASFKSNCATGNQKKGIYVNMHCVQFIGHGERIASGQDTSMMTAPAPDQIPTGCTVTPPAPGEKSAPAASAGGGGMDLPDTPGAASTSTAAMDLPDAGAAGAADNFLSGAGGMEMPGEGPEQPVDMELFLAPELKAKGHTYAKLSETYTDEVMRQKKWLIDQDAGDEIPY